MAIRTIIKEPHKLLRQISKPVNSVGKGEQKLMDDMLETMYDANGIGQYRLRHTLSLAYHPSIFALLYQRY